MKKWSCAALVAAVQLAALLPDAEAQTRRVNAPHFPAGVRAAESAVFWFGQVGPSRNYADVRLQYTNQELWIRVTVFDQWLWVDEAPTRTPVSLESWDAVTLTLDTAGGAAGAPAASSFRFVGELSSWRPRTDYQAAYVGNGAGWMLSSGVTFSTDSFWRGDSPNNAVADRGWVITFHLPFSSLGVSSPPAAGTVWRIGAQLHDRDSSPGPATSDVFWPETFARDQPATWGELAFGLRPGATGPEPPGASTYTVRQGLDGAVVSDAMVGGGSTCAEGTEFFSAWGSLNYARSTTLVAQNQSDVADWPCFSKIYLNFPLSLLPAGGSVAAATLTIYQFGNSDPTQALRSLVQVFTVKDAWDENTITWNSAPLAAENVAQSWVDVIPGSGLPWPGAARTWDLSWAVAEARAAGAQTLRLAVYSADSAYHSGKYFTSSDVEDWNAAGRPTLRVVLSGQSTPGPPTNLRIVSE